VVVTSEPFAEDTRLSGQFGFDLDVSITGVDTSIAVTILSVPPDVDPTARITETMDGTNAAPLRMGYAWLRAFYRDSVPLRGVSTPTGGAVMSANQRTEVQFGSLYTDVVVPAGNRLAFRFSNSEGGTVAANTGGTVTLHTGPLASRILIPVADPPAPAPEPSSSPNPPPTTPPSPPASPPAPPPPASIERASGEDRIGTAVDISQAVRDDADTIVLARADEYADALAGAPLAAQLGAPLLLTGTDRLDSRTAAEIDRLGADQAVLLGGTAALSSSVEDELTRAGLSTRRAAGPNRFATAAEIAAQLPPSDGVFLAEGANADPERGWPDALSASALAARLIRPVLLATRDNLPSESADALSAQDTVTIVGGPDALSEDLAAQVDEVAGTVRRVAGADRYETSVRLADEALAQGLDPAVTWVATGTAWPDGLTAAAAAGASRGLLILVDGSDAEESTPTLDWITAHRDAIRTLRLVGGESAITTDTENQLRTALAG
jgi:putative cell wall-binding protein